MAGFLPFVAGSRSALRRGDVVEPRSPAEILATLDEDGCLEGVPFMPEMLHYLGGRFHVDARVERACNTISPVATARMPRTVLLDDLRCDGSAHGGCQAGCRLYWKEAWLRRASADAPPEPAADAPALAELERRAAAGTRRLRQDGERRVEVYRCQATEFPRATEPVGWYEPSSFVRELTSGNVRPGKWLRVTARAVVHAIGTRLGFRFRDPVRPRGVVADTAATLQLRAGDRVRVKSKAEIERTLDASAKTRGLVFDREMLPYCGQTHTVKRRVERFINERTGEMIELKTDAVILDGVVCEGCQSVGRWFCPRGIYSWWRECWLTRVPDGAAERAP